MCSESTTAGMECESTSSPEESEEMLKSEEPLVGCAKPLSSFQSFLIPNSNAAKQLAALCAAAEEAGAREGPSSIAAEAPAFRAVRRDGCCFYRAFLFSLFERLARDADSIRRFKAFLEKDVLDQVLQAG